MKMTGNDLQVQSSLWESFSVTTVVVSTRNNLPNKEKGCSILDNEWDDFPVPVSAPLHHPRTSKRRRRSCMTPSSNINIAAKEVQELLLADLSAPERGERPGSHSSRNSNKGNRLRRKVTFNGDVEVFLVEPVFKLTKHPEKVWFQEKDYKKTEKKINKLLRKAECASSTTTVEELRGLEGRLPKQQSVVEFHQRTCWEAVLKEQRRQQQQRGGIVDDDTLARISQNASSICRSLAEQQAQQDMKDIKSYVNTGERFFCWMLQREVFYCPQTTKKMVKAQAIRKSTKGK